MILAAILAFITFTTPSPCNLVPHNEIDIPINAGTGISEEQFNGAIDAALKAYEPIAQAQGKKLKISRKWKNTTVNSDTTEDGNTWLVNAYGGLARYKGMTADGYLLVLCHEIGHHEGGFPRYSDAKWASTEGQSDYFATGKCFKEIYGDNEGDKIRSIGAGLVLAEVLRELGKDPAISIDTPDPKKVDKTYEGHPDAQCRLDTYVNGAVCRASVKIPYSKDEPKQGACSQENGEIEGVRPRCWYAPQQ